MAIGDMYTRQDEFNNPRADIIAGDMDKFYSRLLSASTTLDKAKLEEMITAAKVQAAVLSNNLLLVKEPAYIEPPYKAVIIDDYNNVPIALPAGVAATNLIVINLTETQMLCVRRVGVECENLGAHADIGVSIRVNNQDIGIQTNWLDGATQNYTYQQFHPRLGDIQEPWWLPKAMLVRGPATFSVVAQNDHAVNVHRATCRVMGWTWAASKISSSTDSPQQVMV